MKLHYYPETDSLTIELKSTPGADVREIADGLTVDLDEAGQIVGFDIDIDIDRAAARFDLTSVETVALPLPPVRAA